ncbi:MAG: glycosyl hydrolase family 16, partial [Bacteroidota bacterium]
DFEENEFAVIAPNIRLSTDWRKVIIPIPDPSKLIQERGMFFFSAGTQSTGGFGYTFWIDELRFEKVGTIAQPSPAIFFGQDLATPAVNGLDLAVTGLTQTFNLNSGINQTVIAAPGYYDFSSSDVSVAIVNELGRIAIIGAGNSTITAQIGNTAALGSLDITSNGVLPTAPLPMELAENVSSIFSNEYDNAVESIFEPNFGGSITSFQILSNDGEDALVYTNNNFTGIVFANTLDGTSRTTLNIDVYPLDAATSVEVQIRDVGANQELETNIFNGNPDGDDADFRQTINGLTPGQWTSVEIPLGGDLGSQRNNLGALILAGGPNFIFDNIYFFTE